MRRNRHITPVTRGPQKAQTVQQLKYETLLVYMLNGLELVFGSFAALGETSNALQGLIETLPYKGYFGGGGSGTGTTS